MASFSSGWTSGNAAPGFRVEQFSDLRALPSGGGTVSPPPMRSMLKDLACDRLHGVPLFDNRPVAYVEVHVGVAEFSVQQLGRRVKSPSLTAPRIR